MMISSGSGMRVLLHPVPLVEMPVAIVHLRPLVQITYGAGAETYGQPATKKTGPLAAAASIEGGHSGTLSHAEISAILGVGPFPCHPDRGGPPT
jgi:hypothetical protein